MMFWKKALLFVLCFVFPACGWGQTNPHLSQITGVPAFFVDHYKYAADIDDTASFNRAITAAYQAQSRYSAAAEFGLTQNTRVVCGPSKTYTIGGTILLPSQITLDLNGSVLDGGEASRDAAYATSSRALIESAYWSSTQLVSNIGSNPVTRRLVKSVITNGSVINAPCGIRVQAFHEGSMISSLYFANVARAIDVASSWYGEIEDVMVRSSSRSPGEASLSFTGEVNAFTIKRTSCVGSSVGIAFNVVKSVNVRIMNSTFEEGIGSGTVGVDLRGGALVGFVFKDNYIEGVDVGLRTNGGSIYSGLISGNTCIVSNYFIRTVSGPIARAVQIIGNFLETSGGTLYNRITINTAGSSAIIHVGGEIVSNSAGYPSFPLRDLATTTTCVGYLSFTDSSGNFIARDQGALHNPSGVTPAPFTGRQMVTRDYGLPFSQITAVATGSLKIETRLNWDDSQILVFNYRLVDFAAAHNIHGTIYRDSVYQLSPSTGSAAVTIATNTSNRIVVTISDIDTRTVATDTVGGNYNISGMIRHH